MLKIYHNPRCRKSREGLELLENSDHDFEIVKYLEAVPSREELVQILKKLALPPIDLVRKNEAIWKEQFKGKDLTDEEIIAAMAAYPKLIERPIIVQGNRAVIGRPSERILDLL